ncbi:hypothetical protein DM02DRAFT_697942, partial [Periconia macrospinosa]
MSSNTTTQNCSSVDNTIGPYAGEHCRGDFDFTLFFGEVFLSIVPLALLLVIAPFRIVYLWRKQTKVSRSSLLFMKMITWVLLAALDLALLVLWASRRTSKHRAEIPSAALSFVGALVLGLLSYVEHIRSIRPSFLLNVYLLFTVVFDTARSRSYALDPDLDLISAVFPLRVGVKLFLVIIEAREKRNFLLAKFADCPPEASSGVYKRALFWWLNELFKKGYSNSLTVDDLFHLDKHLQSDYLHRTLGAAWDRGKFSSPVVVTCTSPHSLFAETLKRFKWPILAVVPPRLCLIAFNFCQPFLIHKAVTFSQQSVTTQTSNIGYGLIGAYILVFVGIAVSTGQYQHLTFRFITMMRGGLISMLYSKATDVALADADAASSITLMSADIERIITGMETGHEVWSNTLEIALAMYLLERQLGVACAIPIGVATVSLLGSLGATSLVMQRQALWLEAIERRIAATNAMLNSMKGVKMCGLTDVLRQDL